jgi:hypothetical protein
MSMIITSFYTISGAPAIGLTPTIRIWEVQNLTQTLVVPLSGPDPMMVEVGDGFYKFVFDSINGYDVTKTYVARCDGGVSIPNPGERFQTVDIDSTGGSVITITPADINAIVEGVWEEPGAAHLTPGTMGAYQNEIHADVQQIHIDVSTAISLVTTLMKYEMNRTRIDKIAKTLTVYDNDGVTPLKVFDLKDSTGVPSVTEVCERFPV